MFRKPSPETLLHYGVKRRSGRYPWGSGEDPHQHGGSGAFLAEVDSLRSKGLKDTEIAEKLGMNTTQLRNNITWANKEVRDYRNRQIEILKESGLSNVAIGKKLGISEASVRNYISSKQKVEKVQLDNVVESLKSSVDKTGYLDVGVGVERQLGISRTKFNAAVNKLVEDEGYHIHQVHNKRLSDPTGQKWTIVKVLTKDPDESNTRRNSEKIRSLDSFSDDNSMTITKLKRPQMIDLNRIKVRYAEEGGADKDGLIELRRGVKDLDLGLKRYAQVRIGAGENLYLKGMAAYTDTKFPNGVDIIFNTNKKMGTPVEKVLKETKINPKDSDDPSAIFGSSVTKQRGALNIVNEEGTWDTWSTKMSSQFLSKQPLSLVKDRLDDTYASLRKEYDEINSMTNPVVKKFLMEKFEQGLNAKAKQLKAKGLPNTKSHVLMPFPDMKPNEIYAPNYPDGSKVVLVRHPHGGRFEIPDLVVNNKYPLARKVLGTDAPDAVGIHPSVAQKLSGADFDGDTVLVIPNDNGMIKTSRSLKELKNFDPMSYKVDRETITDSLLQTQMGVVSNLITDMTIKGASQSELARAVKHSMVVIDSKKHKLDWQQSARDNGISALKKKYQSHTNPDTGKPSTGASTLISRSKSKVNIDDPNFNPDKYSSDTAVEQQYSNYIKRLQVIKNEANKVLKSIPRPDRNPEAAKVYAPEVDSLNKKLNEALLNAPKERQAQVLTNNLFYSNLRPGMSKDEIKKLKARSLAEARARVGAKKTLIKIDEKEWEAIQARAISTTKLEQILNNADMDVVRKLATPRQRKLDDSKAATARSMLAKGYTYSEVASRLGLSTTALRAELGVDE